VTRPSWDEWAFGIAKAVALRGDCTRRQVGCVILGPDHEPVSFGYNGAPPGAPGCLTDGACPRAFSDVLPGSSYDTGPGACISIHAEANALLWAGRNGLKGAVVYVTEEPCGGCWKLLSSAPIREVIWPGQSGGWPGFFVKKSPALNDIQPYHYFRKNL